ncbi:putative necrosis-inducing factor domain containing protein [Naviculisporaceae sp. PSN 640]
MTLRTILTGAVLLIGGLVHASPIGAEPTKDQILNEFSFNHTLNTGVHEVYCDVNGYTYTNEGSDASPDVGDCKQLCANIDRDGSWHVMEDRHHQIAQYKTCAYGVEPAMATSVDIVTIGNGDIITTITESIKRFAPGTQTKIGASGTMWCKKRTNVISGDYAKIKFGIYHT